PRTRRWWLSNASASPKPMNTRARGAPLTEPARTEPWPAAVLRARVHVRRLLRVLLRRADCARRGFRVDAPPEPATFSGSLIAGAVTAGRPVASMALSAVVTGAGRACGRRSRRLGPSRRARSSPSFSTGGTLLIVLGGATLFVRLTA